MQLRGDRQAPSDGHHWGHLLSGPPSEFTQCFLESAQCQEVAQGFGNLEGDVWQHLASGVLGFLLGLSRITRSVIPNPKQDSEPCHSNGRGAPQKIFLSVKLAFGSVAHGRETGRAGEKNAKTYQ